MQKRIISILFLAILLFSAVSCATEKDDANTTDNSQTTTAAVTDDPTDPKLEAINYNGESFVILARDGEMYKGDYEEFDVSGENLGQTVNTAVYKRNEYLTNKYNIKLEYQYETWNTIHQKAVELILANSAEFDMINAGPMYLFTMASNEALLSADDIPHINLKKPYWYESLHNDTSIDGKNYFFFSSMNVWTLHSVGAVMFNKSLISDLKLDNPYDLVANNKWTYDKMLEMTKKASAENGDGVWNEQDRYGAVSTYAAVETMFTGMGGTLIEKSSEDMPTISYLKESNLEKIKKVVEYWSDTQSSLLINRWPNYASPTGTNMMADVFNGGRALFVQELLYQLPGLTNNDFNVGIVPAPKFDESQENYYSFVHIAHSSAIAVPMTCDRLDMVGRILEDMAFKSDSLVRYAYYDVNMKGRRVQDEESYDLLDVIYDNIRMDIGIALQSSGFSASTKIRNLVVGSDLNIVSQLESVKTADETALNNIVSKIAGSNK